MNEEKALLEFPEEFFKREERSGHIVGEMMKRTWAAELEILAHVDVICKKYGLTYYGYWGTLIGAVRHQGFIPWDDDLDIAMKREDYNKFLQVAQKELPEGYHVLNNHIAFWDNSIMKIANSSNIDFGEKRMKQYHGCPFAVGIDIFPLDYLPRDEQAATEQKDLLTFIGTLMTALEGQKQAQENNEGPEVLEEYDRVIGECLVDLENACGVQFDEERPLLQQLYILYDQIAGMYTAEESDVLTSMFNYIRHGYVVEKELLQEVIMVPFENIMMPIPCGYDSILRKTFGDYMVPRKFRSTHGLLYFQDQMMALADLVDHTTSRLVTEQQEEEILSYARKEHEKKKIILMCNNTFQLLMREEQAMKKLRYALGIFEENPEVLLWWRPSRIHAPQVADLQKMDPQMLREYQEIIDEFKGKKLGIFDEGIAAEKVLELCDAYYGDENELSKAFQQKGKPVMLEDYAICEKN